MKKFFLNLFLISFSLSFSASSVASSCENNESSEEDDEEIDFHSLDLLIRTLSEPLNLEQRICNYQLFIAAHRERTLTQGPTLLQDR